MNNKLLISGLILSASLNTAVAQSQNPSQMAAAMNLSVKAGRLAYLAGRMDKKYYANPSSPLEQISKLY